MQSMKRKPCLNLYKSGAIFGIHFQRWTSGTPESNVAKILKSIEWQWKNY